MGADRTAKGSYRCHHGCQIGGECPGHTWELWYREGSYYIPVDGREYRDGWSIDSALLDAIIADKIEKL